MHVGVSHAHAHNSVFTSAWSYQFVRLFKTGVPNGFVCDVPCIFIIVHSLCIYCAFIVSSSLIAFAMYLGHEEGEGRRARTLCDYDEGTVCTFALT